MTNYIASNLQEYHDLYDYSIKNPEGFWGNFAKNEFVWQQPFDKVLEWDFETAEVKWFAGGKINITENCLDRHLHTRPHQPAIIWESNDPTEASRTLSYQALHTEVCAFANVLLNNGIKKGDCVCIYMPMIPELTIALLACARIGAVHSVVFAGFSATAIADRINDAQAKLILTADGVKRGAKNINLKEIIDEAIQKTITMGCTTLQKTIVYKRTADAINMQMGRDLWWHDELQKITDTHCPPAIIDAEDRLFILYTSGSTGKPKGMVHTCGGYLVHTNLSFRNVFQYDSLYDSGKAPVYFCTADIGWVTGHSYIVYGPLSAGATVLMFEGIPSYPTWSRFWEICDKHAVNIFYTAPTAIRSLAQQGLEPLKNASLQSLKVIGTVGEPINEEAWQWYHTHIGSSRCPIVDTWWQTETGGIMIAPLAGITPTKPAYATLPLFGVQPCLVDEQGNEIIENNVEGRLCIKFPWPSIARTIHGDHQRFKETYFSTFKHKYFTGDGCKRDADGYYRITGRVDDIVIVSGHNLGTAEIENAINLHPAIAESAVVGYPHPIKGNAIYAFVVLKHSIQDHTALRIQINDYIARTIGAISKAEKIQIVSALPKTRSGKIMRRILRKIAEGDTTNLGDLTTLLNPEVVEEIKTTAL
jgi:acetyl-CoA synthetase